MTAWGVVAVCAIGGGVAGPLLERAARRVPRPAAGGADVCTDPGAVGPTPGAVAGAAGVATAVGAASGGGAGAGAGAASGGGAAKNAGAGVSAGVAVVPPGTSLGSEPGAGSLPQIVVVSAVTAAAFGLAAARLGAVPSLAAYCALFAALVAVSVTDLRTGLVPRRLLYPGLAVVAVGLVASSADAGAWKPFLDAAVGGAIAFVVFCVIWWVYPKGLGFGDVRLAGLCGAGLGYLGFQQLYLGFLAAFLLGALGGVVVLARKGARRFPFAPALAAGTAFGVLWGGWLGNLWLHPG